MIDTTTILIILALLILAKVNAIAKSKGADNDASSEDVQNMGKEILDAIGSLGGVVGSGVKKKK